jgi:transposase
MPPSTGQARGVNYTVAQRIQALALVEYGVAVKIAATAAGVEPRCVYRLMKKARQRGFDPAISIILKEVYVEDAPRSGRPKTVTPEKEEEVLIVGKKVSEKRYFLLTNY